MKRNLFYAGTVLIPVLVLVVVEGIFRLSGYAENRRNVFEDVLSKPDYVAFNPDYVGRYFNTFEPAIAFEPFLKKKEPGSFRVFVLGGSSTAGYPHQPYYGFPAILGDRLAAYATGQRVEVINLGMTAVNSYTIWDVTDAVLGQKPDAVVIYAGHNEYYGAFGAGSNVNSLGNRDFLKRTLLRLKRSVLFMALEDLIRRAGADVDATQNPRTMMARVVRDSEIELDGEVYRQGIDQRNAP